MNGLQTQTGTIHEVRITRMHGYDHLTPRCKGITNERASLLPTDKPITCQRCIVKMAKRTAAQR